MKAKESQECYELSLERLNELLTEGQHEIFGFLESQESSLPLEDLDQDILGNNVSGLDNSTSLTTNPRILFNNPRISPTMTKIRDFSRTNFILEV